MESLKIFTLPALILRAVSQFCPFLGGWSLIFTARSDFSRKNTQMKSPKTGHLEDFLKQV